MTIDKLTDLRGDIVCIKNYLFKEYVTPIQANPIPYHKMTCHKLYYLILFHTKYIHLIANAKNHNLCIYEPD